MQKFEENRKPELTFADACRFWSITENMKGEQLDAKLTQFEQTLAELDRTLANGDAEVTGGRVMSAGDLRVLNNIHRYMEDRFGRHLNLLRSRSGTAVGVASVEAQLRAGDVVGVDLDAEPAAAEALGDLAGDVAAGERIDDELAALRSGSG